MNIESLVGVLLSGLVIPLTLYLVKRSVTKHEQYRVSSRERMVEELSVIAEKVNNLESDVHILRVSVVYKEEFSQLESSIASLKKDVRLVLATLIKGES